MFYLVIRTENLTKYYGRQAGVKDLTLEVEPGEVFGLLGGAGAGKTTTIRMLLDFARPTSGRALVLGRDVSRHSLEIRREVGFLPANFSLSGFSTGEACLQTLAGLRGNVSWEYAGELCSRLGVDLRKKCSRFTTAEQQKLGLVQAFMHKPEVLILDEPARGLDPESQQALFHLISDARHEGRSVFYATRSQHEVERVCDRVGIMENGSLVTVERTVRLRAGKAAAWKVENGAAALAF